MNAVHTAERLKELQSLPLWRKVLITQTRIMEWYLHFDGKVCVSFSGGKDSTVLLHIARQCFPDIPAVFSNTGLEYPEIQRFVRSQDNIDIITPDIRFTDVIRTYGYPLIGKEVAEAIYYARRLRGGGRQPDGEPIYSDNVAKVDGTLGKQAEWKRLEIGGEGPSVCPGRRIEDSPQMGTLRQPLDQRTTQPSQTSRGEYFYWRRGCL